MFKHDTYCRVIVAVCCGALCAYVRVVVVGRDGHLGLLLASQASFPRTKGNNVGVENIIINKVMMLLDRLVHRTHEGFEVIGEDGVATEHGFLYCGRLHEGRLMDGRNMMWSCQV